MRVNTGVGRHRAARSGDVYSIAMNDDVPLAYISRHMARGCTCVSITALLWHDTTCSPP